MNNMSHLLIFRTTCSVLNLKTYNCQELGLAKALVKKGYKVSLVLGSDREGEEIVDGVNVYYLTFKAINQQLGIFKHYKQLLESLSPDIIQVHDMGIYMTYLVTKWAKNHDVPCFLIQGNYEPTQKLVFKQFEQCFNKTFGKYVLKNVSGVGYKTKMASRYVCSYYQRDTKPTYIGLDVSKFEDAIERDWISDLHLEGKKILLYVGSVEARRNPLFLVDVISKLPDDYVILIVGGGPLENDLKNYILKKDVSDRCILLGKLPQELLPSLYNISDAFLLASNYEIYGMVILEAMYFGLPVVSSFTAGSDTLIENGKDGFVIDSFDVDKWIDAISKTVGNSDMKTIASQKIKNQFLWDKASDNFLNLYFSK